MLSALSGEGGLFSLLLGSRRWFPYVRWVRLLKRGAALPRGVSLASQTLHSLKLGLVFVNSIQLTEISPSQTLFCCTQKWKQGEAQLLAWGESLRSLPTLKVTLSPKDRIVNFVVCFKTGLC